MKKNGRLRPDARNGALNEIQWPRLLPGKHWGPQRAYPASALGNAEQQADICFVPRGAIIEDQSPSLALATQTDIEFGPANEFQASP